MNRSDEARPDVDDTEDDDRYLVIRGRRWRRTDPALDADVVRALKSHLGRARSQVGRAGRDDDPASVRSARDRVQLAKDEFVDLRITSKLTTGFTVQASAAFSGSVGFDVFI